MQGATYTIPIPSMIYQFVLPGIFYPGLSPMPKHSDMAIGEGNDTFILWARNRGALRASQIRMLIYMSPLQMPHSSNMRFRHFSQSPANSASSGQNSKISREEREERARNTLRIVRVGNQRVRRYIIDSAPQLPTPPPRYAHHDPVRIKQEINR